MNKVSIICCFFNEIKVLEKKFTEIENFSKQKDNFQFIFLDNASNDGTTEFLKKKKRQVFKILNLYSINLILEKGVRLKKE